VVLLVTGSFLLVFIVGNFLHKKHVTIVSESLVIILIGSFLGLLLQRYVRNMTIEKDALINKAVLSLLLLPIIIFESGWSLRSRNFASQLGYILLFAVFGTLISMLVVGGLILATSYIHGIDDPRTAFTYGVLISAVDPVATLATYAHLNVDPLLNVLVFGESVINDAVAIAVFDVLNHAPSFEDHGIAGIAATITYKGGTLLFGSIALGLALGTVYIYTLRFCDMSHSPALGSLFILTSCFCTYPFAEYICDLSGIITVLFCGMIMSSFATPHLTVEGRLLASFLLKQMATLADMTVFLFVGIAVVFASRNGVIFGGLVCGFCLLGRAAAVVPLGCLTNGIKMIVSRHLPAEERNVISAKYMFMMWHAGLRGGIALVLTLEIGRWVEKANTAVDVVEKMRNGTLVVICAFLLVFGGTTKLALTGLHIRCGKDVIGHSNLFRSGDVHGTFWSFVTKLNENVLGPVLIGETAQESYLTTEGGVVTNVLAEVNARADSEPAMGPSVEEQGHRYELFGTTDPAHLARARAAGSPEGSENEDTGEEDSGESGDDSPEGAGVAAS